MRIDRFCSFDFFFLIDNNSAIKYYIRHGQQFLPKRAENSNCADIHL